MRRRQNPHQELCDWANGLRADSARFHEEPRDEPEALGPVCLGCGSRGCQNPNCGPLDTDDC